MVLAACDRSGADSADEKQPHDSGDGETGVTDSGGPGDSGPADTGDTAVVGEWATGGTASMSGDYPDPFTPSTECAIFCAMTLGPCYDTTPERQDVSEGADGLPVRLALRILDDACQPVPGALVEIWHTHPNGLYSGAQALEMCTTGDPEAVAAYWFRGGQVSDESGRVDFDSCLPGWYFGRAIHIHFQVMVGGVNYSISQLFFPQDLLDGIYATEPIYSARGTPDTTNAGDSILSSTDNPDLYLLEWSKQADGAMLAWKTIVIRSSLEQDQCSA